MILVEFAKEDGNYKGFSCIGHAEYVPDGEVDPLCAAVTGLAATLVASLTDILELTVDYEFSEGHLVAQISSRNLTAKQAEQINLLFAAFHLGCRQIEYSYGSEYIQVPDWQKEERSEDV